MEQKTERVVINFQSILNKLIANKNIYFIVWPLVALISGVYIYSIPREFTTETKLAPEMESNGQKGALGSIASTLGLDISSMNSTDAITPLLYPTLFEDNSFLASLLFIKIKHEGANAVTPYFKYLIKDTKKTWWNRLLANSNRNDDLLIKKIASGRFNPYVPDKYEEGLLKTVREKIALSVDSKNGVITITTTDQDALVCKTVCDSVRTKLQNFITDYRTNKAKRDVEYYKQLVSEAKANYEKARRLYGSYADANADVVLESFISKRNDLENDMQLKYNAYSSLVTQLNAARAKVLERTPAFTILKGAVVPIRPTYPKRVVFILCMLMLATLITSIWVLRGDIGKMFK